jgi:small-conductance mechanosensitive channel
MEAIKSFLIDEKNLFIILGIILTAIILTRLLSWLMNRSFNTASEKLKVDPTRYKFFQNAISLIIWIMAFAAIIMLVPRLKSIAIAMFAGAGVFLAILGFAAQQAFANIISGIFIVMFKPYRVGDIISVGKDFFGQVEDITLRHTVITDWENKRIIIPNSTMGNEIIINSSIEDERICEFVVIGVSYDTNIDAAIKVMREEAEKHPDCLDTRTKEEIKEGIPKVKVQVIGFGDSSVNLRANVWSHNLVKARMMHFDLNKSIKERFDLEGIEIPFPYRTIVYKDPKK